MNTKWTRFILVFGMFCAVPASALADDGNLRTLNCKVRHPTRISELPLGPLHRSRCDARR